MKTALSTSAIATTAPPTSVHRFARRVARAETALRCDARRFRPPRWRHRPRCRSPARGRKAKALFSENPKTAIAAKVPIERDRHRDQRDERGPPGLQKDKHDENDQARSLRRAFSPLRGWTRGQRPSGRRQSCSRARRESAASAQPSSSAPLGRREGVEPGQLENAPSRSPVFRRAGCSSCNRARRVQPARHRARE